MYRLEIGFEKTDIHFRDELEKMFGLEITYSQKKNFDGMSVICTAIIPVAALTVQVIDFIFTHLAKKDSIEDKDAGKRVIISEDGSMDLTGYSGDEVEKIIKGYFEAQKKEDSK